MLNKTRIDSYNIIKWLYLFKELDSIDVIDNFDEDDQNAEMIPEQQNKYDENNDGVTRIFKEIINKPIEYWLLRPSNVWCL